MASSLIPQLSSHVALFSLLLRNMFKKKEIYVFYEIKFLFGGFDWSLSASCV